METGLKIVELRAQNVKRLTAVNIKPDGNVIIVGGSNGHGKSSVLDSIMYALAGKDVLPPKPVREGATEATITVDLGEFVATRTITPDGKSTLKLAGKDGGRYSSPQTILDGIAGRLSFDPIEFSRQDPKKQLETLKALVGLDFSALDRQKATKAEERLMLGREVKQLQGQLQGMPQHAGAPGAEVSVAELAQALTAANETNAANASAREEVKRAEGLLVEWVQRVTDLERELAEAEAAMARADEYHQAKFSAAARLKDVDTAAIAAHVSTAEATNCKVRENRDRIRVAQQLEQKEAAYTTAQNAIEVIEAQKQTTLREAKFPVDGLSFDEDGVLVKGIPFQQASAAEQLRVSVAMAAAMNPKLKVMLIRDGSLLDSKSMAVIAELAEKYGSQVWIERVSTGAECSVVIEDGAVARQAVLA